MYSKSVQYLTATALFARRGHFLYPKQLYWWYSTYTYGKIRKRALRDFEPLRCTICTYCKLDAVQCTVQYHKLAGIIILQVVTPPSH